MNEQNLTMAGKAITSREQAQKMGRKGGSVSSPAKKLAAKLRELKKKGLSDENCKRVYELMTDSDMTDLDILVLLEGMRSKAGTLVEKERVAKLYMDFRKFRFGTKDKESNVINIDRRDYTFVIKKADKIGIIVDDNEARNRVEANGKAGDSVPLLDGQEDD